MKRPTPDALDTSLWPSVDVNALEDTTKLRYQQRVMAIELYATGSPIGDVETKSKLNRRVLYRMIERAVQAHPDGRPWGFRGLVPGAHTKAYERRKASIGAGAGLAGSFSQLLEKHPKLEQLMGQMITDREVRLLQKGDHIYVKNLRNAHNRFTSACRSPMATSNSSTCGQVKIPHLTRW